MNPDPPTTDSNVVHLPPRVVRRGRPKTVAKRPRRSAQARAAELRAALCEHIDADEMAELVGREDHNADDVLWMAQLETAKIAAGLEFDRDEAIGKEQFEAAARISSRRIRALLQVAEIEFERMKLRAGRPSPEMVKMLVEMLNDVIVTTAFKALPEENARRFADEYRARVAELEIDELL